MSSIRPILIFAYGNPGRGDDALGPELAAAIDAEGFAKVECQDDMQLQVEHVVDLEGRERILFVDADVACVEPYAFGPLDAEKDGSYTSHAMSPGALLHAFHKVYGTDAPPAYVLRIRGYDFELGEMMGAQATRNLTAAISMVKTLCGDSSGEHWAYKFTADDRQTSLQSGCPLPGCGGYMLPTDIEELSPPS